MTTFNIMRDGNTLKLSFGAPAQNDQIVRDVSARLLAMKESGELDGGGVIRLNGPASMPVAVVIAHAVAHLFEGVAIFDPKLAKYVVAVSHSPSYNVGDLID